MIREFFLETRTMARAALGSTLDAHAYMPYTCAWRRGGKREGER